jgi:AcrR family transcriptional regulator
MAVPTETETRVRLIEAAGEVFARVGFRDASVREICQAAGANIAAVNYHFGGKEQLYREVLAYSFELSQAKFPLLLNQADPPEAKLRMFLLTSLNRMLHEGKPAWHGKLMVREMGDPSGSLELVAERYMKPHFGVLLGILRELVGDGVSQERLLLLALSTMGQTTFFKMCSSAMEHVAPNVPTDEAGRRRLADHITMMVVAGAGEIRRQASDEATKRRSGEGKDDGIRRGE